ncbi:MAG: DUF2807 domain-containing protein [Anaerolineaceae bacterium]|nr:DUF2807 domain-containing protein [Anaerolineaceae bacterium]
MEKETRVIQSFDKIRFKDFGNLFLTQGDQESLTIEADAELMAELISEVRDDTLVLGIDDDWFDRLGKVFASIISHKGHKVNYYLTFVDLHKVNISGQCRLTCPSLETDTFKLNISGMGNLHFDQLSCDALEVNISGRGEFTAAGKATDQHVRISGSGEYDASELASSSVRVAISGQGNAKVWAEDDLDITISGLGQVNYRGRPKLRQVISGMGKSRRIDDDPSNSNSKDDKNDQRDQDREESVGSYST